MMAEWASQAARLPPSAFRRYLAATGWTDEPVPETANFWRYRRRVPAGEVFIEVPRRQEFADYARRVTEIIEILTMVEDRPARTVIFELGQPGADVVSFRFVGPETDDGSITLDDSIRIREARKRMLLAIAHSAIEPLAHHPRLARADAVAFLSSCREVPAEPGSYLTPILVPVSPVVGNATLEDPFPRCVTKLLALALGHTVDALAAGEDERLLKGAAHGLSSNFLAALAELRPPGAQGSLDIAFAWAARRPAPTLRARVRLDHGLFEPLKEAARVLRETSPAPGTEVEGYIAGFDRAAQDPSSPGEIAIIATIEGRAGTSKIFATLSPNGYKEALDAHRDARRIRLTGTLVRAGRRFVLRNPGDLVVIPDDDA